MAVRRIASAAPAGTVLAFDFGTQRIGVAVGESKVGFAHPLTTVANGRSGDAFASIAALIDDWQPVLLLVGLPIHADGTPHAMTAHARRFGEQLRGRFGLPVAFADERFTTRDASRALRGAQVRAHARKAARDSIAAQLILQAYLDEHVAA